MDFVPRFNQGQWQPCCLQEPIILAVDDNPDNLLLLSYVLEPLNCKLLAEDDGAKVLSKAKLHHPDLILLDIILPNLDGFQIMRQLRQDPVTRNIPVIAVTALVGIKNQETLLLEGFSDYISKPYILEDLEAIIVHHLNCATIQQTPA
jgi:CheY-like chemotaxis protein